jgi:hypothetical protein
MALRRSVFYKESQRRSPVCPVPGLPDGMFSNQKSKFGYIWEGLAMEDVGIFYGHLIHFTVFWYILWTFGTLSPFGYFVPRKIWQPCPVPVGRYVLRIQARNLNLKSNPKFYLPQCVATDLTTFRPGDSKPGRPDWANFPIICRLYTLFSVLMHQSSTNVWATFIPRYESYINFDKNGLCYILRDFLQTNLVTLLK